MAGESLDFTSKCSLSACADKQAVAKWETTLETSTRNNITVLAQSMLPAVERVVLLLDELSMDTRPAVGLIQILTELHGQSTSEMHAGVEWIKWTKYGRSFVNAPC